MTSRSARPHNGQQTHAMAPKQVQHLVDLRIPPSSGVRATGKGSPAEGSTSTSVAGEDVTEIVE